MRMASLPIAVIMQKRVVHHRWASSAWSAVGVVADPGGLPLIQQLIRAGEHESYLVSGLQLQLYPDENEGYYENWIAPESKVFIKWRMQDERAMPVQASVSYAEGTRMFDCGEPADGVAMPAEIHAWLAAYLRAHHEPGQHRGERVGRRERR